MANSPSRRFLDRPAAADWLRTTGEFVVRDHGPGRLWVLVGVSTLVVVMVAVFDVAVGATILDTPLRVLVALLLAVFVLRSLFVFSGRIRLLELRIMLLSSALRVDAACVAIVRSNGLVVDSDQGFAERFGAGESIDGVLDHPGLEPGARERVWAALGQRHTVTVEIAGEGSGDEVLQLRLSPLPRPSGYFLLRGELQKDERGGVAT